MRPVNLIPAEERRGEQAPLRTGFLVYLVVGAFVAILVAVTALVLIGNKVAESESEVARLQREDARVSLQAQRLASYTQFRILSEQRVQTVSSLADSRFDWERVMRELSLVLPSDVWLVDLTATAAPGVGVSGAGGSSGSSLRADVPGPALELNGCASGQQAVAGFVATLKDIDGVTRVGIETSELADRESGAGVSAGGDSGSGGAGDDCRTRNFIAKFQLVVAFDAAPVPITGATEEAAPAAPTESESDSSEEEAEGS